MDDTLNEEQNEFANAVNPFENNQSDEFVGAINPFTAKDSTS